jgi:HlyD family secretion protein
MKTLFAFLLALPLMIACNRSDDGADAYGNFEADEVMVSAEGNGRLVSFRLEEGDLLDASAVVGCIDTLQLHLKKEQLKATALALGTKIQDVRVQVEVLEMQRANLMREKTRLEALLRDGAATPKQLDDLTGELEVVESRIAATRSQLNTANRGILSERRPLELQIEQIEDQIRKSVIINSIRGTVISRYTAEGEIATFGKPLYKIANLENIYLRAYVGGEQLTDLHLGQTVAVSVDGPDGTLRPANGRVVWIAEQAEFTPKVIQTREERVNLVYAFKVLLANDGSFKIGMPGEVKFQPAP